MQTLPKKNRPEMHDLAWKLLQPQPPGRLLDIPSGPGYFAQQAKQHGFEVVAAEIDESLHVLPDIPYRKADMSKELPFETNTFDYIVSIEGIEHIENPFFFLRECTRVLKPNGKLLLTTPNVSSLENRFSFFLTGSHGEPAKPIRDDLPNIWGRHINLIPFHQLEIFLRLVGFEIQTLTTQRMRTGSLLLYPVVYPYAFFRYLLTYKKRFQGRPDEQRYWKIFKQYLSSAVLCGRHLAIVAVKKK